MKQYDPRTFRCLSRRLCHLQRPELPGLRRDDAWLRHATGRNSGAAQAAAAAAADGAVATGFHGVLWNVCGILYGDSWDLLFMGFKRDLTVI